MSALSVRLDKLAARIPLPQPADTTERPQIDFKAICERISAETARVAALPPAARLAHILDEIASIKCKAATPFVANPADGIGRASLAESLHKFAVMDAKKGFPNYQYEIRACEIQILRENSYDVTELDRVHRQYVDLSWQFYQYKEPLPPAAQAIIDQALNQEAVP